MDRPVGVGSWAVQDDDPLPDAWTPAVPFKAKAACRRHIPKQQHRVTNWAAYDAALRQRGSLTVWFTDAAIAAWRAAPRTTRGGQPCYSALAIATALTLRAVFRLALRQTEGLIGVRGSAPDPATARAQPPGAGPLHPEPPGRDAGGGAAKGGERAGASAGGQHGTEALRPGRVADREARHQAAPGGPVAKFFRVRFVRKLRSTEPVSAQLWIEILASGSPIHNQELGRPAFSRRSHTGRKKFATGPFAYSITSSARARIDPGIVRPSASAA